MFFLTRAVLWLPLKFLIYVGAPFKFDAESNLRHHSEKNIIDTYNKKKAEHYSERVMLSVVIVLVTMACLFMTWLTDLYFLMVVPVVLIALFTVDAILIAARAVYYMEETKKASSRQELVPIDAWKDTSLNAILKKRDQEIDNFIKENPNFAHRYTNRKAEVY